MGTRRNRRLSAAICALGLCFGAGAQAVSVKAIPFSELQGWDGDNHQVALETFINSCGSARAKAYLFAEEWRALCSLARTQLDGKFFFEAFFQPVLIREGNGAKFTGYFEPELRGSRVKSEKYATPLYRLPPDKPRSGSWFTRAEIMDGALDGKDLEIAWIDDPVEAFFLQIQGSGRVKLPNGKGIRVGYAGHNGHNYRSIGLELVRREILGRHEVSAERIKNWVRDNPELGAEILAHNPSYVFFREIPELGDGDGPIGAMQVSITPTRSVAVDPKFTPLGAPIWLDKRGADPLRRLMIAQDVGSAIKGAQRADIFYGTGAEAGKVAGRTMSSGRMYVLLPIKAAERLIADGAIE